MFMDFVGFEIFTAVVIKSINFCDMTPCSPLSCNLEASSFFLDILKETKIPFIWGRGTLI
jgi:hypothetical protein